MKKNMNERFVVIDSFPQSARKYADDHAIVCVDVIRSTTTAITAVAAGRRCFPVPTLERALSLSIALKNELPLLAGELNGETPAGFGITNSPYEVGRRDDIDRPLILLSSSGTQLIHEAQQGLAAFLACFRNATSTAESLKDRYRKIAIIGAGSRNEFREEDQLCCAWIADVLVRAGFAPATKKTKDVLERWRGARPDACMGSKSVQYLLNTHQERDLEFVLSHIDDIEASFMMAEQEVILIPEFHRTLREIAASLP